MSNVSYTGAVVKAPGGSNRTLQDMIAQIPNVKDGGASTSNSDADNTTAIVAFMETHPVALVPEGITYDDDSITLPLRAILIDLENKRIICGANAIQSGDTIRQHVTLRGLEEDSGTGFWIMPRGNPYIGAADQVSSIKIFLEDYETLQGGDTASDYRDGGFVIHQSGGHNGMGSLRINSQCGGHFSPFTPDIHFGFRNNQFKPLRILYTQAAALPAGTYFSGGVADFNIGHPVWRPGKDYVQGKLINQMGRIYEAQTTSTGGSTRPVHASYQLYVLSVDDTTGFQVEENVDTGAGGTFPRGKIYDIPDGTTLRLYNQNDLAVSPGFQVDDVVTGSVTTTTATVTGSSTATLDYDYEPLNESEVFNAPPVAGRVESDGNMDWKFIGDVKGGILSNESPFPIVLFGDENSVAKYYDPDIRFQFHDYKVWVDGTSQLLLGETGDNSSYVRFTNDDAEFTIAAHDDSFKLRFLKSTKTVRLEGLSLAQESASKTSNATTANVDGIGFLKFNDGAATNFTGFTGGSNGQVLYCRFNNANTTLVESAALELKGTGNITTTAATGATFIRSALNNWTLVGGL